MNSIKVKKVDLLAKLQANREAHRGIFLKAQEGYRKAVVAELEKMLEDTRAGRRIQRHISLVEPMDQTRDYDRAISMLSMSVETEIDIDEGEFAQYVLDDWSWKQQFATSTMSYQ